MKKKTRKTVICKKKTQKKKWEREREREREWAREREHKKQYIDYSTKNTEMTTNERVTNKY